MGTVSHRKYIRWHPDEASEPTSTLVLTSPQNRFVDLRILLPPDGSAKLSDDPSKSPTPKKHLHSKQVSSPGQNVARINKKGKKGQKEKKN